ncbi:transposase [Dactylosporangium sp. CA-233914]|uniref:transposase n=1 Tax=Dactylosporangium sp. CA-233914 TaxID=3239934 RepID=UPI003D94DE1B
MGYRQVWHKLTAGLAGLAVADPSENALWQARARLGVAPLRWLFGLLRGPAATKPAGGVRWCGLLVCAIDGTTMAIPDGARNLAVYTKQAGNHGRSGYPLLRLVALVACGTRTVIDVVFGPTSRGELDYTHRLARSLHAGMLVLLDRHFDAAALISHLAATDAHLLVRVKANRRLRVLRRYPDGSYLSQIGTTRVRVVECEITIATTVGRHTGVYRLAGRSRWWPGRRHAALSRLRWRASAIMLGHGLSRTISSCRNGAGHSGGCGGRVRRAATVLDLGLRRR